MTLTGSKAGTDTLTATVLGQSATASVSVSNQNFAFTVPTANALIALTATQTVTLVWSTGGVPQAGKVVTFSTTRGTFNGSATATTATATTSGTGAASVTIAATTAGPAIITASAAGVSAQVPVTFVATDPNAIDLQASPATVPTQGQSTITAIVRDAANNLVEGQTVSFQLTDVTGGSLSVGAALTDVQGKAQTVYTASSTSRATNGVKITASIPAVPAVPVATVTMTVGGQTVYLSLGTGNTITPDPSNTQFIMPFIVQAQDAAGNAVNGVTITLAIHSVLYAKGGWVVYNSAWVQTGVPGGAAAYHAAACRHRVRQRRRGWHRDLRGIRRPQQQRQARSGQHRRRVSGFGGHGRNHDNERGHVDHDQRLRPADRHLPAGSRRVGAGAAHGHRDGVGYGNHHDLQVLAADSGRGPAGHDDHAARKSQPLWHCHVLR